MKTIVVLLYQILSSHAERFRKLASLKAYAILNFMEILFWFVVVIITFMGIAKFCSGVSCGLTWVSVLIAIMLWYVDFTSPPPLLKANPNMLLINSVLASWTAVVSFQDLRNLKKRGNLGYAASNRLP